ncbi:MAG: hypothetical protein RL653_2105 [Pseudomonadota bacterium]|jgi:protein-tyrosine phosphatase
MAEGFADLHCHLLPGVDDGAKGLEDALEMARALVSLGFSAVAPSPHARREYAGRDACERALVQLCEALAAASIPLALHVNAEHAFFEEGFLAEVSSGTARRVGGGRCVLVEAPYTAPLPTLTDLVFRMKVKGCTPLIAHPERCMEFEREGRARAAVEAGALLQLDVGALIGRYGRTAQKLARAFLDEGLYAVAATDLHGPVGARDWVGRSLEELRKRAGEAGARRLLGENPHRLLAGEGLDG